MIAAFDFILLLFVIICALTAISVKDLLSAVYVLGAYSFFMCLLWAEMGAVDVAFTEASVSAGIGTVLFIASFLVLRTCRTGEIPTHLQASMFHLGISRRAWKRQPHRMWLRRCWQITGAMIRLERLR
ncbi:MAG: DUF4040 domain-containing protein [Deltaproteobacteria bacterium]|nr:DUF4040 domain-containing protein [Deltaproteobacteria bacterium]